MSRNFVSYYRVSTQKQGLSGLGLDAQEEAVNRFLNEGKHKLVDSFQEIETGKGSKALEKRPALKAALEACRKHDAILLIAKLDRLARNVHFVSGLLETGVEFVAADMPQANKVMIRMYSVMAEWERDQISSRTKAALAVVKARGGKLGISGKQNLRPNIEARRKEANAFADKMLDILTAFRASGFSQRQIATRLNELGIRTARGGDWSQTQVARVQAKLARNHQLSQ